MKPMPRLLRSMFFFFAFSFGLIPSLVWPQSSDYKFVDSEGHDVALPHQPIYTVADPGPWKGLELQHLPQATWHMRQQGLEMIRILVVRVPHAMGDKNKGRIEAIYVLDKDDLIIGYHAFGAMKKEAVADIWINGVINYVQIVVGCSRHGLWKKTFRF